MALSLENSEKEDFSLAGLIKKMKAICPMPVEWELRILATAKLLHVRKNTILLRPGEVCNHLYYIEKGMLSCHEVDGEDEYCGWLMLEGDIATSVDSFNSRTASKERIKAEEACKLYIITYDELEDTCKDFPNFRIIRQKLTEQYYLQSVEMDAQRKRPPEKFYHFLKTHKHYSNYVTRVPTTTLASFMGIARGTLHRIKQQDQNRGK